MRFLSLAMLVLIGCGGSVSAEPTDAAVDTQTAPRETGTPDVAPPSGCTLVDPMQPPIGCEGASDFACGSTANVASCPMDNACMATVMQSGGVLKHRIGRIRLYKPEALMALAPIAFDPNINPKCANGGTESLSWLLRFERDGNTLFSGSARPSTDGRTFSFITETFDGAAAAKICPGFVGPSSPVLISPIKVPMLREGSGVVTDLIREPLNIAIFDGSGAPIVLPFRETVIRVPSLTDPSCVGSWNPKHWCDGDTLGWTTGGSIVGKILIEDADRIPVKSAGCQSLCAILANDATKTDGKTCKRGPDGKVPEFGDTCVGGTGCKNAFLFSATFGSYGVNITP